MTASILKEIIDELDLPRPQIISHTLQTLVLAKPKDSAKRK
jgi:hypothetical protein